MYILTRERVGLVKSEGEVQRSLWRAGRHVQCREAEVRQAPWRWTAGGHSCQVLWFSHPLSLSPPTPPPIPKRSPMRLLNLRDVLGRGGTDLNNGTLKGAGGAV